MSGVFGSKPKRNKALEAMQARERQSALLERNELESEQDRIARGPRDARGGRSQLRSRRRGGLKAKLGV